MKAADATTGFTAAPRSAADRAGGHAVLGLEKVSILDALGRVLGEDIVAERDNPPWDNSGDGWVRRAMGGYQAGTCDLETGDADGDRRCAGREDAVKVRRAGTSDPHHDRCADSQGGGYGLEGGRHRTYAGFGSRLQAGTARRPTSGLKARTSRKASASSRKGRRFVPAKRGCWRSWRSRSSLSINGRGWRFLSTGDELADLDERFSEEKIINSNSYGIAAAVQEAGGIPLLLGIARDTPAALKEKDFAWIERGYSCAVRRRVDG